MTSADDSDWKGGLVVFIFLIAIGIAIGNYFSGGTRTTTYTVTKTTTEIHLEELPPRTVTLTWTRTLTITSTSTGMITSTVTRTIVKTTIGYGGSVSHGSPSKATQGSVTAEQNPGGSSEVGRSQTAPRSGWDCNSRWSGTRLGRVTRIIDGDTIEVEGCEIRLVLVNAPEISESEGVRARNFLAHVIPVGTTVLVDQDDRHPFDTYGRILAVVYKGGININALLIESGVAELYKKYCVNSEFGNDAWAERLGCKEDVRNWTNRGAGASRKKCHPSYPDVCIPPPPPDLDCEDIPYRNFRVLPPDPHHFDGDGDGIGCET